MWSYAICDVHDDKENAYIVLFLKMSSFYL